MDEYISREIAMERIKYKKPKVLYSEYGVGYERGLEDAIGLLNAIPATDVQSTKHGQWICEFYNDVFDVYQADCSVCKKESSNKYAKVSESYAYCPNCGVKMDLKDEDT